MRFPARAARIPDDLPGWDPALSRLITVECDDGPHGFHVLDTGPLLEAEGIAPTGTVIAVHGNPTYGYLWRHLARASLAQARSGGTAWRIVAPDQLDMGFSERLPHEALPTPRGTDAATPFRRLSERISDLEAVIARLGLAGDTLVTLGHDWGGTISLGWAARHRERVHAAITLNTAVHQPEGEPIPAPLRAALAGPLLPGSTVLTPAFSQVTLSTATESLPAGTRSAYLAPYTRAELRAGIGGFVADIPVDAGHPSHAELSRIGRELRAFDRPALLLWGPADPVFQEYHLHDLLDRLPHADVHRFETAGHLLAEDADVHGAVLRWLDGPGRPRTPVTRQDESDARSVTPHPAVPPARQDGAEPPDAAAREAAPSTSQDRTPAAAESPDVDAHDRVPGAGLPPLWSLIESRADDDSTASVDMSGPAPAPVSWAKLARVVGGIAAGLVAHGVRPGDRVSLLVPPGNNLTAALYACVRIGAVVVVADAGLGPAGMTRAVRAAAPQWIIGELPGLTLARVKGWRGRRISVKPLGRVTAKALAVETSLTALARTEPDPASLPSPRPQDPAAILFTSGSTGPAKGVLYTHGRLSSLVHTLITVFGITPDAGLVAGFAPFALLGPGIGATTVTPDMSVTKPSTLTATAVAEAAAAGDASIVFASPAALVNIVATSRILDLAAHKALAKVRLVLSAGAPVPLELMNQVAELFPNAEIHSPYGMTEGLLMTDIERKEIARAKARRGEQPPADTGVCVGAPVRGVELLISPLDDLGRPTAELLEPERAVGRLGEIVVSADHIKERYDRLWLTDALSKRDSAPGRPRHRTNDIGHVDASGRLWIEGRLQHVIATPEGPLGPGGPEAAIDTVPGVFRSAVVGVGPAGTQAIVAVIEPDEESLAADPEHAWHGRASRPPRVPAGLAPAGLAEAVREAARVGLARPVPIAAVLVTHDFPTDIRHNSKIDRSRLGAWATRVLGGGRVDSP